MRTLLSLAVALTSSLALAQAQAPAAPLKPVPTDKQCRALGKPHRPHAFAPGETLEFALDALGAEAGTLTMRVLPARDGHLPVEVTAKTNTFFSKIRRVTGTATSYLNPRTLRPARYVEEARENEVPKSAWVSFVTSRREVDLAYEISGRGGKKKFRYANDALDPVGAFFLLRQLPLKEGAELCFDAYGIRTLWRVHGRIVGKEHVSLKVGEFQAWHLAGEAVRLDAPQFRREIHLWVSADERRLPLAAVGAIDLGAVRATLTAYSRDGKVQRGEGSESMKW